VLLVHGLGEHTGRYAHVAAQLNAWGWQVFGYDQRGHAAAKGPAAAWAPTTTCCTTCRVIDACAPCNPASVLLGHSMGGLVAARFVAGGAGWHGRCRRWCCPRQRWTRA